MEYLFNVFIALVAALAGGAIGGIVIGGKHLGNDLAAMMGGFYGSLVAIPGVAIALLALQWV